MKRVFLTFAFLVFFFGVPAQRKMENLDRGLVAVQTGEGIFVSWRILGTEWYDGSFNLYRDGIRLNEIPLQVSNYSDATGTTLSAYSVTALIGGVEQAPCESVMPLAHSYLEIVLQPRDPSVYEINDATAADLDGDGQYEIIVKRIAKGWNEDNTHFSFFEAYKLDGTFLWEINVGPNILPDVEINIAAFDFDEDGKAEVFLRTSEGTVFGDGAAIDDTNNDGRTNYRYSVGTTANMQFMNAGPEFLSLVDGMTGAELDRVDFIPRGSSSDWGDNYGHRASKYFFGAPYLDGLKPSLFIGRGIYTKTVMRTYDVVNKKLIPRWEWSATTPDDPYYGQGNHNYTIADVDEDGRDEIVWGSMTIDDDGTGLYSTRMGHGDAMHVGDLDPFRKGTEIFKCLENSPMWGTILYDGATGEILIHHYTTSDCGRCMAGNISDDIKGAALWGGRKMFSAATREEAGTGGGPENYRIYWDGDLLEEMTDHSDFTTGKGYGTGAIFKYEDGIVKNILLASGATSCNYTKGTPSLQADLLGDWREEVIWRKEDNTAIRVYTTTDPTPYRNYTLMHDHQYRQAICWQMCGYNQPPHVSYFLGEGEGITVPPPPALTNERLVYSGNGAWNRTSPNWMSDGTSSVYTDGRHVLFDASTEPGCIIVLEDTLSPSVLTVNSPKDLKVEATNGSLAGEMLLIKQGLGILTLNGKHSFSGRTEIWNGRLIFDGELTNSPVWVGFFGQINASGLLSQPVTLRYGARLAMGESDSSAILHLGSHLSLEAGSGIVFDLFEPGSPRNDSLWVEGNLICAPGTVFRIQPHLTSENPRLPPGDYCLMTVNGTLDADLSSIRVEGITGLPSKLKAGNGKIYLEVKEVRASSSIKWNGDKAGAEWDLSLTENFRNNDTADIFVDKDRVLFNDEAVSKTVNIVSTVTPTSVTVEALSDYLFQGNGKITGDARLNKRGSGKLTIRNNNDFTGKVLIADGTLEVEQMPTAQNPGALGAPSSDPEQFEINGGSLSITGTGNWSRALFIGEQGGNVHNPARVVWQEAITGGTLSKTGSGELVLAGANTHEKTRLKAGTLTLQNENTNPGKTIC
ncbi:MAG TPA: autotransporter-associated beta strand repeat-containing protein, partial [Prolixibacteraceae bacterium]|nr:autotransporter-associated beta strand repeat-containing protein [Prolixibacteraceae bacterium]